MPSMKSFVTTKLDGARDFLSQAFDGADALLSTYRRPFRLKSLIFDSKTGQNQRIGREKYGLVRRCTLPASTD